MNEHISIYMTAKATKDLEKFDAFRDQVLQEITVLSENPYKGHSLTGSLKGFRSLEFTLPGGQYRAAYAVLEETRECIVFLVGPHEGFYKIAERRAKSLPKE